MVGRDSACDRPYSAWTNRRWRMARESLKQSRRYSRAMGRNVDIQFQSEETAAKYADAASERIDSATDYELSAGRGDA